MKDESLNNLLFRSLVALGLILLIATVGLIIQARLIAEKIPVSQILEAPVNMLVVAPHQDDGVIIAGGLGARNISLGGNVTVLYLTRPAQDEYAKIRAEEAISVWSLANVPEQNLIFLPYHENLTELASRQASALDMDVQAVVDAVKPSIVIVPLYEGGQKDHDYANQLIAHRMSLPAGAQILQGTEYNPYFSAEDNPEKLLRFVARLLPFVPSATKNLGLFPANQIILAMSDTELNLKKRMLERFASQRSVIPMHQFGYADRFEQSETRPKHIMEMLGKYISGGSVLYLGLICAVLFLAGILVAGKQVLRWRGISLSVMIVAYFWLAHPHTAKEDLVFVSIIVGGACTGLLINGLADLRRMQS